MTEEASRTRAPAGGVVTTSIVLLLVCLGLGYLMKDQCVGSVFPKTAAYDGDQYRRLCYSDVFVLYGVRHLDEEPVPYINGNGDIDDDEAGDLEYPAGTGIVVAIAALIANDAVGFFAVSGLLLAFAGIAALLLLQSIAADRKRLYYFAAAPSIILYSFHNWDLLAVASSCAALYFFARKRDVAAGVFVGLGAAAKIYPGLLLPAFVLARARNQRRWSAGMIVAAASSFAAVNVPFLIANPNGWLTPWKFQSTRFPNLDDIWYFVFRHLGSQGDGSLFSFERYPSFVNAASSLLFVAGAAWILIAESRRERFRPYATAFGLLVLFLLTNKVFSPQFALWVLPFFALVRVPWYGFAAFAITEAMVWFTVAAFFLSLQYGIGDGEFRLSVLEAAVVARTFAFAWLLWMTRRAEDAVSEEPDAARENDDAEGRGHGERRDEHVVQTRYATDQGGGHEHDREE